MVQNGEMVVMGAPDVTGIAETETITTRITITITMTITTIMIRTTHPATVAGP